MKISVYAILAGCLLAAPVPAFAQVETRSVTVRSGDLDLTKPAGVTRLERRVGSAVKSVCANDADRSLEARAAARACATGAREAAQADMDRLIAQTTERQTTGSRIRTSIGLPH